MNTIDLAHGAGGKRMAQLLRDHVLCSFRSAKAEVPLHALDDAAVIDNIVFTTDSHTVQPIFFPGGDIGRLAVAGTVNDIAALGACPIAMASAMVIEEGFSARDFAKIIASMAATAAEADVEIVTGDTKVVEKGGLRDIVVTTSAIGKRYPSLDQNFAAAGRKQRWLLDSSLRLGDRIIINGPIADHGIAVISRRDDYGFSGTVRSDVAPLNSLVERALEQGGVVAAKDATRGGIANALNEMAEKSGVGIRLCEEKIPIRGETQAACDMLGIDPLSIGNEGKMLLGIDPRFVDTVLAVLRAHPYGRDAAEIGEVVEGKRVTLETTVGGRRFVEMPAGDPIPRIC
jgi:hydrogenase expression/formation protein HypE